MTENVPAVKEKLPPIDVLNRGRSSAKLLMEVIESKKKPVRIQGETYLEYEDWQLINEFDGRGYTVRTKNAVPIEIEGVKGAKAEAELIDPDGNVIGGAENYCMRDEPNWKDKPWFQLASMAQTRAGAKALRNKFSFIAPLAGVKSTPAEEMDGVNHGEQKAESRVSEGKPEEAPHSPPTDEYTYIREVNSRTGETKGKPWTLYNIVDADGVKSTTFDTKIADSAEIFRCNTTPCVVLYEETAKGKKMKEIHEYKEPGSEG